MHLGGGDTAVELAIALDRRREERRVKHLKRHASRGDGHASGFSHFAHGLRRSQQPERLPQVLLNGAELHPRLSIARCIPALQSGCDQTLAAKEALAIVRSGVV